MLPSGTMPNRLRFSVPVLGLLALAACGRESPANDDGTSTAAGAPETGGAVSSAGAAQGGRATGGAEAQAGSATEMGGNAGTGGLTASGGTSASGGGGATGLPESVKDFCQLPADPGTCDGDETAYAYDPAHFTCEPFSYTGCGGNDNRFESFEACYATCAPGALLACPEPPPPTSFSRPSCALTGCWYSGGCLVLPLGRGRCRLVDPSCQPSDPSDFQRCSCLEIWACSEDRNVCPP